MARRIRSLKPEILEDEKTAGLSDTAFRIFVALITMADDFGRFRADPRLIEKLIYWLAVPERAVDVALRELGDIGLLQFYSVRGQRYGMFRTWAKHQRVDNVPIERRTGILPGPNEEDPEADVGASGGVKSQVELTSGDEKLTSESAARARGSDRIGSDRIGAVQREPHCTAPVVALPEAESETHLRTAPAVPVYPEPPASPEQIAIAVRIRQHGAFRQLDAHGIAGAAVTSMIGKATKLEWVTQAIDDCAAKSIGLGLTAEALQSKLIGFIRHAKPPKADEREQKSGPAYREEPDDPAVLDRIRRMPKRVTAQDAQMPPVSIEETKARATALLAKVGTGGA